MILAVDIGNTHTEIGIYIDRDYLDSWKIATGVHRTEDELMIFVKQFLAQQQRQIDQIEGVAISSVVPGVNQIYFRMCEKYLGLRPLCVHHDLDLQISIAYNPPHSVGADRICNAVAAYEKYQSPCIIVDIGTATTFDVVSRGGVYEGGVIALGLETAASGLHLRASKLPTIAYEFPKSVIGKTTEDSMKSGIMFGTVKLIDGLIEMISAEMNEEPALVATGGFSKTIAPQSSFQMNVEPQLVLDGLISIYWRNSKK